MTLSEIKLIKPTSPRKPKKTKKLIKPSCTSQMDFH
jgi:hypothetical protein